MEYGSDGALRNSPTIQYSMAPLSQTARIEQAPRSKECPSTNDLINSGTTHALASWNTRLVIGAWSFSGAWNLGFGTFDRCNRLSLDILFVSLFAFGVHSAHGNLV